MAERAIRFDFLGRDVSAGRTMRRVASDSDKLQTKLRGLGVTSALAASSGVLPLAASLTALSGGAVAAFGTASVAVGAFGLAAVPILQDVFEESKKVTDQEAKFDLAARDVATSLARSNVLRDRQADLLAEMDPALRTVVGLLRVEGTRWADLSVQQQKAAVNLRQDKDLYKELVPAQKEALNALLDERDAWARLSPVQQQALKANQGLKQRFEEFQKALEPQVLSLWARGLTVTGTALRPLTPLAKAAGNALSVVLADIERAVNGPGFARGVDELAHNAGPAIIALSRSIGNVGSGLLGVFNAFAGGEGVLDGLVDASERFERFGQNLGDSQGFQQFLAYVRETGPVVSETLHNIAEAGMDILTAAAPLGPVTLQLVSALADLLSTVAQLPSGLGTGAVALALYGPLLLKVAGITRVLTAVSTRLGAGIASAGQRVAASATATATAEQSTGRWARTAQGAGRVVGGLTSVVGGLTAALPIAGVAVAAVGAAMAHQAQLAEQNKQAITDLFVAVEEGGAKGRQAAADLRTLEEFTRSTDFGRDIRGQFEEAQAGFQQAQSSMSTLDRLQQNVTRTQNDLTEAIDLYGETSPNATMAADAYRQAQSNLKIVQDGLAQSTKTLSERIHDNTQAVMDAASAEASANTAKLGARQATLNLQQAQEALTAARNTYGEQSPEFVQAQLNADQATEGLRTSILGSADAAKRLAEAHANTKSASDRAALGDAAYRAELVRLRETVKAGSPLRRELDGLIADLDDAARERTSTITLVTRGNIPAGGRGPAIKQFASGGEFGPGLALLGEEGPELVEFEGRGRIRTAQETRRIVAAADSGGGPAVRAMSAPAAPQMTPAAVAAAVEAGVSAALAAYRPRLSAVDGLRFVRTGALREPGRR